MLNLPKHFVFLINVLISAIDHQSDRKINLLKFFVSKLLLKRETAPL